MNYKADKLEQLGITEADAKRFTKILQHVNKAHAERRPHTLSDEALEFAKAIVLKGAELGWYSEAPEYVKAAFKRVSGMDVK